MKNSTFSAQVANNLLTLLQGYSKTIRLLLVMLLTLTVTTNAWGATYTKVTSAPADWSGEYIVVYESDNTAYVWTGVDAAKCNTTATISSNSVTGDFVTVTIAPMTGGYSIKVNSGTNSGKYISGTSESNKLNFNASAQLNTLSYETDWVKITSNTSVLTFNKASSDMRFRYYKSSSYSSQQHIQLYKLSTGGGGSTTVDPEVTFSNGEYTIGGAALDLSTLWESTSTGAVTYSVTNAGTTGATVNGTSFTATAAGTCTVQASQAATATHNAATATATITVTAPAGGGGGEGSSTGTINFNSNAVKINAASVNGNDNLENSWTITTAGTTSFTANAAYYQVGSSSKPATSITFTTTLPQQVTITNFEAKFGGFSGTAGKVTLKVGDTSVGTGQLNTTSDVTIQNTEEATGKILTVTVTSISKGVKAYYISYTYTTSGDDPEPDPDPVDPEVTFSDGAYTVDGAALDLSTLLTTNSTGAVTYSVKTDGGTGATINGTSFTATAEGTCTVQASIAPTATHNAATATATISVTAPATVEGTWTLVTNATNLKAGDEIVIASNTKGKVAAALTNDYLGEYGVSFSNDKSTITKLPATALVFTLGGSTGSWTLTNDEKLLGATAAKELAWDKGTTTWSISIEEGNATIQNATDTYGRFLHNVQSTRFTTYTSDANANMLLPQIYKKAGNTPDPTKLATPENLSVSGVTASSATLSWTEVENANGYIVNLGGNEHETNTNSLILNELTASTTYKWTVKAKGDGINYSDSENSSQSSFTTDAATYTITYVTNGGTTLASTSGTALPDPLPTTERDHYTFAGWYTDEGCTQAAKAGAEINANTTLYAKWTPITYTVTFNAGSGTCATEPTQGDFETGLELPTATPCDYASTNGWSFEGWSETTVSETTVRPAIHTGNYKPTDNITLHAVYAKTGTAQGAAGEFILSLQYEGTTYYVGQTFDKNKLSAETEQTNAARFTIEDNYLHYEGGYISHVATKSSTDITRQTDKAKAQAWTITEEPNTITFTSTADDTRGLGFNYNDGSPRFAAYKLNEKDGETIKYPHTFTKTSVSGGNVQVTTYNSKPSCEAPVDPNWVAATITHTAIKANCGSTTVLGSEGENGPATISFSGTDLQNSVTVTASDGFLVSTDKTAPEKYAKSVIIYPNSTGSNIGKITQNVHVIANATAKNESYTGTITLTGADITNGPQVINVTAAVTCTQYTITWSVNGDDSHQVTYSPGDALQLPEIDITPCDGMDHVGWTDNMSYVPGTDILFTETTDMTVTSDKTYYAVFATLTSSGGGETTTTLNFSQQGYANQEKVTSLEIGGVTVSFSQGEASDPPAYYNTGTAIRVYAKGSFTVSSTNTISQIEITFGTGDGTNEISTNVGDYSDGTWKGSANEIIFTVGGDSKHRRIKSIAVTSAGGGASYYTGHTTTCSGSQQLGTPTNLQATDITHNSATLTWDAVAGANKYKVVINGTEYISNTNSYTTHDLKQQTAYTWTVQAIGNGTTFTDSEISAEATFTTGAELIITWSVSTATSTTTITKGQPIGANLKTPATPAACEGKHFMGWSASSTVNSDGSDFTPITSDIVPETNVTYYAVFATKEVGDGVALTQCNGSTEFNAGDNIVIVASGQDWSYLCYQETSGTTYIVNHEFVNNATTLINDDKNYWTLETANGGFYLGDATNGYMYIPSSNNLNVSKENKSIWAIEWNEETSAFNIKSDRWLSCRSDLSDNNKYKWRGGGTDGKSGTTDLQIYKISGTTTYTDYSTSCGSYTVTYYGFTGGYSTTCNKNPAVVEVPQGKTYQIPNCEPTDDPAKLGRTFAGTWNTKANGKGIAYEPGDEIANVSEDITLYAQWALNTSDNTTLPTDVEDLATTDIIVTGGTTLTLQAGTTTINSLTLKGGLQENGTYAMPAVNIPKGATLVRNNNKINLDLKVNNNSYYPFAVPFEVENTAANVNYINSTLKEYANANKGYGKYYRILEYNGALRAENGVNSDENWVHVGRTDVKLMPGKGYAISAVPASGQDTVTIRITMTVDNAWLADGEQESITVKEQTTTRDTVPVTAYTGAAATEHPRHAGWNFVANPYLANFAGSEASNEGGSFINGEILINNGEYSYGGEKVPYVTIPTYNFAHYYQVKLSDATLSPAYSFFVQVGTDGTMTFGRQQAPASIAARNAEERPVKMDVDITLSDNHSSDQTGIIISDRYSDAYEIGRDLEKMFGSAANLTVYTLMADNTPLAYQALAIRSSMQVIPVGYRAPEQGEYTFALNTNTSSIDLLNEQYEQLVLVDYQTGELTNLLIADYTFYSERVQSDSRFALYAVPRQNAPTDLPNAIGQDKQAQKIIHNGHLYILRDGNVYNGNGQIVK